MIRKNLHPIAGGIALFVFASGLFHASGAGLLGYWPFDGNYNDLSGQNHPAQAGPAGQVPVFSADVAWQFKANPNARSLDMRNRVSPTTGNNCYAFVPGSQSLYNAYNAGANATSSFTVSCWVKGWPTDNWVPFVSKNGEPNGWQVRRSGASNEVDWTTRGTATGFTQGNGDFNTGTVVTGAGLTSPGLRTGNWHHLVCTFDGTDKKIYLNSQLVSQQTNANAKIQDSTSLLVFGARDTGAIGGYSRTMVDDVAIWDVALSQLQINELSSGADPRYLHNQAVPWNVGEPFGIPGKWGIKEAKTLSPSWQVNNLNTALGVLMSQNGFTSQAFSVVDFKDPNSPGGGSPTAASYLTNTGSDDEDFAMVGNCCIRVTNPGAYTFEFKGDDGFTAAFMGTNWTKINASNGNAVLSGEILTNMVPTGDTNTYAVATLAAGDYNFRYLWYERGGGAFNRVRIASGDKTGDDGTFKLLGDPAGPVTLVDQAPMLFAFNSSAYLVTTLPSLDPANVTLSWDTKYTSSLSITPALPGNPPLTPGINSVTVPSPTSTTTYTLTGTTGGQTRTRQLTIFVDQPPMINHFAVNDSTVVAGAPISLNWDVIGAASLSIDQGVGAVTPLGTGSTNLSAPPATTTYTLTATNAFGSVTAQTTVNIGLPPVIDAFSAADTNVLPGGLAHLSWQTTLADTVSLTPRPGSVAADGSYFENPATSTTYALTAANAYASVSQQATVNVAGVLTIASPGWIQTRVSSPTALAAPYLGMCDQLLAGSVPGATSFGPSTVAVVNQGDSATGVFVGGETLPPGGNGDNFVVRSTATLRIHFAGYYTFGINNDDGGRLRIDGQDVIVDDAVHGPTSITSSPEFLTAGDHTIEYIYFEATGGMAGECYFIRPDGAAVLLATNMPGPSPVGGTDLKITEFCADNTELADAQADTPDWIEIHNPTASTVNLAGYFLTDSALPANDHKWAFPSYSLPAGGYLVVFASGKDTTFPTDQFHTNFTLPKGGGYLALTKDSGTPGSYLLVDSYTYPAQEEDNSYGRYDAENYTGFFDVPSPGGPNSAGVDGFVGDTHFSVDRGIKTTPFTLTITCDEPTAEIRYTLDGTPPSAIYGTVYTAPLAINKTTVLRVAAFKQNWKPTNVDTLTYLFLDDVLTQSVASTLADGWPQSPVAGQVLDYGMDSRVVSGNQAALKTALQAIPTMSIVTALDNLLHPVTGIYVDAGQHGENWERPCSVEYINDTYRGQTNGEGAFQIDCGLRIRGGYSRSDSNPKHAFRLFFQNQYDGDLKYPLFGGEGANTFEKLDVQTSQNYSWSFDPGTSVGATYQPYTFVREVSTRDNMRAMGQPYTRSRYVHLYLNGKYWGLFLTQERPSANFGETYLGGDEDNYDVVKSAGSSGGYNTEATDGTMAQGTSAAPGSMWARLWWRSRELRADTSSETSRTTRYFNLQGMQGDGATPAPGEPKVLDPDNLADYMLNSFYSGSFDAPMSTFLSNASNNWYGMKDRTGNRGFVFFAHDHEHGMATDQDGRSDNRLGPWGGVGSNFKNQGMYGTGGSYVKSNPAYIHEDLAFSLEYRVKFGDRAHRNLKNSGALVDANVIARIDQRAAIMDQIVLCESARWGDSKTGGGTFFGKNDWLNAMTRLRNWVNRGTIADLNGGSGPGRAARIIQQLRAYKDKVSGTSSGAGDASLLSMPLYPLTDAPIFSQFGGIVPLNYNLTLTDPNVTGTRTIYWRTDAQDPRMVGGAARAGNGTGASVTLASSGVVKARIFNSTTSEWSALTEALFVVGVPASSSNLIVSEINYNPKGPLVAPATDRDDYEFIELWNPSADQVELDGVAFTFGIAFDFTSQSSISSIAPGERIVLVRNLAAFQQRYPDTSYPGLSAKIAGVFVNSLDNSGEGITLRNNIAGADIASFTYDDDGMVWPKGPDGNGFTLCFTCVNPTAADKNDPSNWFSHPLLHGNPGGPDCTAFSSWAAAQGISATTADEDFDGLDNLVEYALGSAGASPHSAHRPQAQVMSLAVGMDPPADYETITFSRRRGATDVAYAVQTSTDLTAWNADAVLVARMDNADGTETLTYRAALPFSADNRRYLRVKLQTIP